MDHPIAIFMGMAYFGCYLVNPHVQTVQNMCGKGGRWCFGLSYGRPKLGECDKMGSVSKIMRRPNLHCKISDFDFLSVSFDFLA